MSAFLDHVFAAGSAFIAGGTRGINLGIAKRLSALGAPVPVAGRNPDNAAQASLSIGSDALGLSCEVRDYDVDPSGQRFLADTAPSEPAPIAVLVDWPALLPK